MRTPLSGHAGDAGRGRRPAAGNRALLTELGCERHPRSAPAEAQASLPPRGEAGAKAPVALRTTKNGIDLLHRLAVQFPTAITGVLISRRHASRNDTGGEGGGLSPVAQAGISGQTARRRDPTSHGRSTHEKDTVGRKRRPLADDHELIRSGLRNELHSMPPSSSSKPGTRSRSCACSRHNR